MSHLIDPENLLAAVKAGEKEAIRQSTLGQLDVCGMRVAYDRMGDTPYSTGTARAMGTAYHFGLETFFDQCHGLGLDVGMATPECVLAALEEYDREVERAGDAFHLDEGETHQENRNLVEAMVANYLDQAHYPDPNEWQVVATELEFAAHGPVPNTVAKGTIDLVLRSLTHQGHYRMEDHKTANRMWAKGKEAPRKHVQFPFYFAYGIPAVEDFLGLPTTTTWSATYAIMTRAGKFERRLATPNDHHKALIESKARWALELIGTGFLLPNPSSNLCSAKFCDHWSRCPWGEVAV